MSAFDLVVAPQCRLVLYAFFNWVADYRKVSGRRDDAFGYGDR